MSKKIHNIFALIIAMAMVFTVCIASIAEEATGSENEEWVIETQVPPELAETKDGEPEDDDEDIILMDDDWGYVDSEVIAEHTPAMTQEFIHADDPDWVPEEAVEEVSETVEAPVTETEAPAETEAPTETEAPAAEDTEEPAAEETEAPAEETEETEKSETEETEEEAEEETETPDADETEESDETEDPEAEEETEEKDKITVTVITTMLSDTEMQLSAVVMDPEERTYTYQWQQSVDGGETYEDLTDATEQDFVVELTEENISNFWRVRVKSI